jgi:site-specific recombinase XerD
MNTRTSNPIQPAGAGTALQRAQEYLLEAWLHYTRVEGLSEKTVAAYERGLKIFAEWLQDTGGQATPAAVREFKHGLLQAGYSPQTVNLYLAAVRSFYRFLVNTDRTQDSPAASVKGAKRSKSTKHKREALTAGEVRAVFDTCGDDLTGVRDRAIITLMSYCALRTIEVHRANIEHLRTLGERLVLDVWGKGRAEPDEIVVIPVAQEGVLRAWVARRASIEPASPALFVSLSRRSKGARLSTRGIRYLVKSRFERAGVVGKKTTHSLRHTAITAAILGGASLIQVQSMARHQSPETTMNYVHEVGRLEHAAEDLIDY